MSTLVNNTVHEKVVMKFDEKYYGIHGGTMMNMTEWFFYSTLHAYPHFSQLL